MFSKFFNQPIKQSVKPLSKSFSTGSKLIKSKFAISQSALLLLAGSCLNMGVFAAQKVGIATLTTHAGTEAAIPSCDKLDIAAIMSTLPIDSTYNSSVLLYSAALINDSENYQKALYAIMIQVHNENLNSFKAWMLGRILLAAMHMKDEKTMSETLVQLKTTLAAEDLPKDEFRAWALGYIAAFNGHEYHLHKGAMLKAAMDLTKPADALWAHVMNLQAAARNHDKPTFKLILNQMRAFTHKATIAEALSQIPSSDWQAWAIGMVTESAALIGDVRLYQDLRRVLPNSMDVAIQNNSKANAMLAQITANKADKQMQTKLEKEEIREETIGVTPSW